MIVAIYPTGAGLVPYTEFRVAVDVATALAEFVAEYTPPATGYAGLDTGWAAVQDAGFHMVWNVDRDADPDPVLLAVAEVPDLIFVAAISLSEATVLSTAWETIDGVVSRIGGFVDVANDAVGGISGYVKVDGGSFKMRLCKGEPSVPISAEYVHVDTGGVWEFFQFNSNADPDLVRQVYTVEGALVGVATSASVRFGSLSILKKDW